jgi:hypothetical protein
VKDKRTQSVNICTPHNREGTYEQRFYYCSPYRVPAVKLGGYTNLTEAVEFLRTQLENLVRHYSPDGKSKS